MKSLAIHFDAVSGRAPGCEPLHRRLSHMSGMFHDEAAYGALIAAGNPLIYEFYDLERPATEAEIAFGTSILFPGKVGDEFYMTKGHFHEILNTAEVYHCLRGRGYMLMESRGGACELREMVPGTAVYVPPGFAHRSINVSPTDPLITFFAFRADAGHDYGSIERKGFRKLLVDRGGKPELIDNPKWKQP